MRITIIFTIFTLLLGSAFGVNAALLQINFTGSISSAGSFSDPTGLFSQGDSLSGFWSVETTTFDSDPNSTRGIYNQAGAPAFQMNIGSSVFQTNTTTIQILDDHTLGIGTIDAYDVLGGSATSNIVDLTINQMQITLRDTQVPLDVFSSDALPDFAPNPADFDQFGQVQGQLTGNLNGEQFFMNLEIDNVSVVPAPAAVWLFGTALIGLVGFSKRRKAA